MDDMVELEDVVKLMNVSVLYVAARTGDLLARASSRRLLLRERAGYDVAELLGDRQQQVSISTCGCVEPKTRRRVRRRSRAKVRVCVDEQGDRIWQAWRRVRQYVELKKAGTDPPPCWLRLIYIGSRPSVNVTPWPSKTKLGIFNG